MAELEHGVPANLALQAEADAKLIMSRIGAPGGDKIRFVEKTFKVPGIESLSDRLNLVVVDFVSYNAWYDRIYSEKDRTPPACFALGTVPNDDLVASASSPDRQADSCRDCPNNEFGSKGAGKACGNHVILAVAEPNDDANSPLYLMQLPPTAVKYFRSFVNGVAAQHKKGPYAVEVEVYFDPASKWPSVRFGNQKPNPNWMVHFARAAQARSRLLTEPDVSDWKPVVVKEKPATKKK